MPVKKTFNIKLDLKRPVSIDPFGVVEGDNGNVLHIVLTDDGAAVDLTDCRVIAVFTASGGTAMQDSGTEGNGVTIGGTDHNEIDIDLFSTSYSADGLTECELQVYSGENNSVLVTSARFNFTSRRSIINDDTIRSTDKYPVLTALISQVTALAARLGDMVKSVYDADNDGVVDAAETAVLAEDAQKLGGELPAHYATAAALTELTPADIGAAPATHAAQHGSGGDDPITPADIGAAAVHRFTAQVPATWTATPSVAAETTVADGTVAVAQAAFLAAAENTPGAYVFTYDGTNLYWTLDGAETALADYGLTLTGTPADGNTITVTYTEVAPYAQQVAVEGVLESDKPTVDLVPSATFATAEAELEAWGLIYDIQTADGSVTLYATEAPETAFSIQMEVVR